MDLARRNAESTTAGFARVATPDSAQLLTSRDPWIDFMRGLACISFLTAHFEAFTWLDLVFWERLSLVSGAEVFVILSGFLIGIVHRRLFAKPDGAEQSIARLWRRVGTLYLAYVAVTLLVVAAARFTPLNLAVVTTFRDAASGSTYFLTPPNSAPFLDVLHNVLFLRTTPHQVQILGLYAALLALTPFVLVLLRRGHPIACLLISLTAWALFQHEPIMLTGALFENGFPLLAWQIYFFTAVIAGWHRQEILGWLHTRPRLAIGLWTLAALVTVANFLFAQATDNPAFPTWYRLDIVSPATFHDISTTWFTKNTVPAGRMLGAFAFTVTLYRLLGLCWSQADRALGWLLKPLGQSSLYVFLVHVPLLALLAQWPIGPAHHLFDAPARYDPRTVWPNTLALCLMIGAIWTMVRLRVLFGVIPR